jgi:Rrf2 family protein
MQITRQADYAVRAVLYLAQHGQTARLTTAIIGREQHIPLTFLTKIVSQLSAAGIIRATRGSHGGVELGLPPADISLLDIVEIIDGPVILNDCVLDRSLCPLGENCAVRTVWCNAQAELVDRLMRTTFAALAKPKPHTESALELI